MDRRDRIVHIAVSSLAALEEVIRAGECGRARAVLNGRMTMQALPADGVCPYCDLVWLALEIRETKDATTVAP